MLTAGILQRLRKVSNSI